MTDEQPTNLGLALTDLQSARVDFARRDLEAARAEDLAQMSKVGLVLLAERLMTRLDDMLKIVDEAITLGRSNDQVP